MGQQLFDELNHAAYCRAIGIDSSACEAKLSPAEVEAHIRPLSDLEANGVPLSPEEIEIADYMVRHGVSHRAASLLLALNSMPAQTVALRPHKPAFHSVVEYASPVSMWNKQDITPFYEDQRAKYQQRAGVWVGD